MTPVDPPRLAERLLARFLPPDGTGEGLLGDLHELHARNVAERRWGPVRAGLWYWRQALRLAPRYLVRRGLGSYTSPRSIRQVVRGLARSPGFTLVSVATLGVALGANAVIFGLVEAVLLAPLPFPESDRLVSLRHAAPGLGIDDFWQSEGSYLTYRSSAASLEDAGLYRTRDVTLAGEGEPERVRATSVTASYFSTLRVPPALGRVFRPEETRTGGADRVVLGHDLWMRRFGADPDAVGRTVQIDGRSWEVVGVMPRGFHIPGIRTELWLPLRLDPTAPDVGSFSLRAVARLRPDASLEAADRELDRLLHTLPDAYPGALTHTMLEQAALRAFARPLRADEVGQLGSILWLLFGGMGCVLAIACANVANLVLARAADRRPEMALRAALGGGRVAIAGHLLGEGLALGFLGGIAGAAMAWGACRALGGYLPEDLLRFGDVRVTPTVLLFLGAIATTTGGLFGILPLRRQGAAALTSLSEGGRGGAARSATYRVRRSLVVSQVALAFVLLVGSGLMVRTLRAVRRIDPGFVTRGVLTFRLALPEADYPDAERAAALYSRVVDGIGSLAGVVAVGAVSERPLVDERGSEVGTYVASDPPGADELPPTVPTRFARDGYFEAMGIPLLRGRTFVRSDAMEWTGAAVVSRAAAERFWPGRDPLGERIAPYQAPGATPPETFTVVGVVGDIAERSLTGARAPVVYYATRLPVGLDDPITHNLALTLRVSGEDPGAMMASVRDVIRRIDPALALFAPRTADEIVAEGMAVASFTHSLLAVAAGVALLLGTVGMFGVIAYVVSQRTQEIGVRMALGAHGSQVRRMVLGESLGLASGGVGLGLLGALILSRFLRSVLFGVSAVDPLTYVSVSLLVLAVVVVAALVPAWRASAVPPSRALRGP